MTNPTDWQALCAELVDQLQRAINDHGLCLEGKDALMFRARAALAQPEPPSLKEQAQAALLRLANESNDLASQNSADIETIRRALEALPE